MIQRANLEEKLQTLYSGRYEVHVDSKSRLAIPAEFRGVTLTRSNVPVVFLVRAQRNDSPYIAVYDCETFLKRMEEIPESITGECPKLCWDKQGRIVLSDFFREHAEITHYTAVVIGSPTFNHFEIWATQNAGKYGQALTDHSA